MSGSFPAPSDGSIPATIVNGVDQIRLTQWHFAMYATQYLEEIARGVAYGTQDSRFTTSNLLEISLANVASYAEQHIQCLQTLIANKNLLVASGTANAITLSTRIIDDSLESGTYAKNAPLPLNFRDGLELDFVAIANNTGAVTISIPSFQGVGGALNIVKQDFSALTAGDIKTGYRYTIICDQTNNRFILKDSFFREATTTSKGLSYLDSQIKLTYSTPTSLLYSSGTFNFDDGSGSSVITASGAINFVGLVANTSYYVFAIHNPTTNTSQMHYDISLNSPTLPVGFTKKRLVFAFYTNASSQLRPMIIDVDGTVHYITTTDSGVADLTNGNFVTAQVPLSVPRGVKCDVKLAAFSTASKAWYIMNGDSTFVATTFTSANFYAQSGGAADQDFGMSMSVRTNTNGEIRIASFVTSGGTKEISIYTQSYKIII